MESYDDPFERYSYRSPLTQRLREQGGRIVSGRVTVRTAASFGFCWGVDRAVAMVQDAFAKYPGRRIWLLDQIIHNPRVNADFRDQGVRFVRGPFADPQSDGKPTRDDVVIIPAFSATVEDTDWLKTIDCTIVDTTCPWVIKPHKRTIRYVKDGFTTIIHGLFQHEETAASASLIASMGGQFLVVADRQQTRWVCDVIRGSLPPAELLERLPAEARSADFDPGRDLAYVGTINQTTMLASETREIERLLKEAIADRDGAQQVGEHFRELNTICGATQDNQDAVGGLVDEGELDLMIVVGGYDSSNTKNLTRVGRGHFPSYHVDGPLAIRPDVIRHRCSEIGEFVDTEHWLPEGDVVVGFTAGASTPDTLLAETISRVLEIAGAPLDVAVLS